MGLDDNLPDELRDVAERLQDARPTFSELEMEQLKVRAMARISGRAGVRGRLTGHLAIRSRGLVVALAALLLGGTAAAGIAGGGFSTGHSNAAWAQYYPPHSPCPRFALPWSEDQGGSETVYIFGRFFAPNAKVSTNNAGITVTKPHYFSQGVLSARFTASKTARTGPVKVTVINPTTERSCTRRIFFVNGPPSVRSAYPSSGKRGQTETVTITGTNFEPGATLKTNNSGISVSHVSESGTNTITATFAISKTAALGTVSVTVTNPDGTNATGNVFKIINPTPTVTSAYPSSGKRDQTETVTITGTNFEPGATLKTNNSGISVSHVSESGTNTITATFAISKTAALGTVSVTVTNPDGTNATGNVFKIINPTPTVTSAYPSSGKRDQTETVTITGTNFEPGATLKTNNSGISVGHVSESGTNTITATFAISKTAALGTVSVTVTNPDGTNATGNVFKIINPTPTVTSAYPSSGKRDQTETVTITGTNFEPGATLKTNNSGISVSHVSESGTNTITATFAISKTAALGTVSVTVTNPDGTNATGNVFKIINPTPTVTSAYPSSGKRDQTETVTITGTNFEPGATLKTNNSGISVSHVSESDPDTITATFSISNAATLGGVNITVTNPDGTTATGNIFTVKS